MLQELQNTIGDLSGRSIVLAVLVVLVLILYNYVHSRNALPGPTGVPILGYWPFLDRHTVHLQLDKMKKKYGDVFGINVAGQLFVNLGTVKAIKEAHIAKSDCFSQRSMDYNIINKIIGDSVVFTSGEKWRNLRKFFLNHFKERGMTSVRTTLDLPMTDAMMGIIEDFRLTNGQPVSLIDMLQKRSTRLFKDSLFANSDVPSEDLKSINDLYQDMNTEFIPYNFLMSGTIAKYILLPFTTDIHNKLKKKKKVTKIITEIIKKQKPKTDNDSVITAFYKEKELRKRKGDPSYEYFTDEVLAGSLLQFVGDGSLTSAIFVSGFIKSLLDYPQEQEKIFQELQEVVGPNRQPSIDDKNSTPYINAFLNEVLRISELMILFPSLECTKETMIGGYKIPKGAITLVNMWSSHHDPDTYENPEKFDPSRFLPKEGKSKAEHPITFGVGKRSCLGEGFVMIQAYLFVATLVKNFHLVRPEVNKKHNTTIEMLLAKGLDVIALPRNK